MTRQKYKALRASKYRFPTFVRMRGHGGAGKGKNGDLVIGHRTALAHIEAQLGGKLLYDKVRHTATQWVWLRRRGQPFVQRKEAAAA